jgi:hypothetical protein
MVGLIIPFLTLFAGIIWLSIRGEAMPMAFWVPSLAALLLAILLAQS